MTAQIATIRRKDVKVPTECGGGEIVFKVKGLSPAALMDFFEFVMRGEKGAAHKSVIDNGVEKVESGLVDENGVVFNIARLGSVEPYLTVEQAAKLSDEILLHSQLDRLQKKD